MKDTNDTEVEVRLYVHRPLEAEVVAIGGHYCFTDEVQLPFEEKTLFYHKGYAVFDTTCCGAGGCSYALVQGFVVEWKSETEEEGFFVSRIRPVRDLAERQAITRLIKERDTVQQVQFA
jgi:hypothetical protein